MGNSTGDCGTDGGQGLGTVLVCGVVLMAFPRSSDHLHNDAGTHRLYLYGAFLHDGGMGASSFTCSAHPPVLRGDEA